MKNKLLLLEDVHGLGRSGEIVSAKPGYVRNFLIPQKKAVFAGEHTIRLQEKLQEERKKQAVADKKDAEVLAAKLEDKAIHVAVKVDQEGHMYGSVSAVEIVRLIEEQLAIKLDKRNVVLAHPVKQLGVHEVALKLKEGVPAKITLEVKAEGAKEAPLKEEKAPKEEELPEEEAASQEEEESRQK